MAHPRYRLSDFLSQYPHYFDCSQYLFKWVPIDDSNARRMLQYGTQLSSDQQLINLEVIHSTLKNAVEGQLEPIPTTENRSRRGPEVSELLGILNSILCLIIPALNSTFEGLFHFHYVNSGKGNHWSTSDVRIPQVSIEVLPLWNKDRPSASSSDHLHLPSSRILVIELNENWSKLERHRGEVTERLLKEQPPSFSLLYEDNMASRQAQSRIFQLGIIHYLASHPESARDENELPFDPPPHHHPPSPFMGIATDLQTSAYRSMFCCCEWVDYDFRSPDPEAERGWFPTLRMFASLDRVLLQPTASSSLDSTQTHDSLLEPQYRFLEVVAEQLYFNMLSCLSDSSIATHIHGFEDDDTPRKRMKDRWFETHGGDSADVDSDIDEIHYQPGPNKKIYYGPASPLPLPRVAADQHETQSFHPSLAFSASDETVFSSPSTLCSIDRTGPVKFIEELNLWDPRLVTADQIKELFNDPVPDSLHYSTSDEALILWYTYNLLSDSPRITVGMDLRDQVETRSPPHIHPRRVIQFHQCKAHMDCKGDCSDREEEIVALLNQSPQDAKKALKGKIRLRRTRVWIVPHGDLLNCYHEDLYESMEDAQSKEDIDQSTSSGTIGIETMVDDDPDAHCPGHRGDSNPMTMLMCNKPRTLRGWEAEDPGLSRIVEAMGVRDDLDHLFIPPNPNSAKREDHSPRYLFDLEVSLPTTEGDGVPIDPSKPLFFHNFTRLKTFITKRPPNDDGEHRIESVMTLEELAHQCTYPLDERSNQFTYPLDEYPSGAYITVPLSVSKAKLVFSLCLAGLEQLHRRGIVHGGFDLDCIFITSSGHFSIIGFANPYNIGGPSLNDTRETHSLLPDPDFRRFEDKQTFQLASPHPSGSLFIDGRHPCPMDDVLAALMAVLHLVIPEQVFDGIGKVSGHGSPHAISHWLMNCLKHNDHREWVFPVLQMLGI